MWIFKDTIRNKTIECETVHKPNVHVKPISRHSHEVYYRFTTVRVPVLNHSHEVYYRFTTVRVPVLTMLDHPLAPDGAAGCTSLSNQWETALQNFIKITSANNIAYRQVPVVWGVDIVIHNTAQRLVRMSNV